MRDIKTREGYEFWDKICAVQSYAFLLSPDGRRVVKTPGIGDWIDKHEAQVIVDHAQEDFNEMKSQLAAFREELADLGDELQLTAEERDHAKRNSSAFEDRMGELQVENGKLQQRLADAERRNDELLDMLRMAWADEYVSGEDCKRIDAALNPNPEAASHDE